MCRVYLVARKRGGDNARGCAMVRGAHGARLRRRQTNNNDNMGNRTNHTTTGRVRAIITSSESQAMPAADREKRPFIYSQNSPLTNHPRREHWTAFSPSSPNDMVHTVPTRVRLPKYRRNDESISSDNALPPLQPASRKAELRSVSLADDTE